MFDALVSSILNYGSEVWGYHEAKDIEMVHTKFCRKILCIRQSTNVSGLFGELGRVPFSVLRKINMLRYWYKLLRLDDQALPKIIYHMLKDDANDGLTYIGANWAYQIKSVLERHGFGYVWQSQNIDTVPFNVIKQRILDNYYQRWYAEINNSSRLSSYCRFKHTFNQEKYLDMIHEKKYKIVLSQFRISAHHLEIERGRYPIPKVARKDRTCKVCKMNTVESEYHFYSYVPHIKSLDANIFQGIIITGQLLQNLIL